MFMFQLILHCSFCESLSLLWNRNRLTFLLFLIFQKQPTNYYGKITRRKK